MVSVGGSSSTTYLNEVFTVFVGALGEQCGDPVQLHEVALTPSVTVALMLTESSPSAPTGTLLDEHTPPLFPLAHVRGTLFAVTLSVPLPLN